jgi:broad specificity phosphatase PhoE
LNFQQMYLCVHCGTWAVSVMCMQVNHHPGLRERHFGDLQGLTYEEAPAAQPAAWAVMQGSCIHTAIPGGGESLQELDDRIAAALLDIAAAYPGATVACGVVQWVLCSVVLDAPTSMVAGLWLSPICYGQQLCVS